MRLFYDSNINTSSKEFTLSEEESKHIVRVLRMKEGDQLVMLNGNGGFFTCEIIEALPKKCKLKILKTTEDSRPEYSIHIAIGPTKQLDRMEWFVEKATELGITEITLISCKNQERSKVKTERLERKAVSAMKQSHRTFLPVINELTDVKSFIKNNANGLIAHCYELPKQSFEESFAIKNCPILIGPEGDFTKEEIDLAIEYGYKTITLGNNRLRTETAGLYVCMKAIMEIENKFK